MHKRAIFWTNFQLEFWGTEGRILGVWLTDRLSQSLAIGLLHLTGLLPLRAWKELEQANYSNASGDLHRISGDDDDASQPRTAERRPESPAPRICIITHKCLGRNPLPIVVQGRTLTRVFVSPYSGFLPLTLIQYAAYF